MARVQAKQTKGRRQVDSRETFDYTTPGMKVSAHPLAVDNNLDISTGYRNVMQALAGINPTLQTLAQATYAGKAQDMQQGAKDFKRGKDLKQGSSEAMVAGYELMRGQSAAKQYETDLSGNLQANASNLTEPEFQQLLQETANKHTQNASDYFLEGFFDGGVLEMEQNATDYYKKVRTKKMQDDTLLNAQAAAVAEVDNIISDSSLGTYNLADIDTLATDPIRRQELQNTTFFADAAQRLRDSLTQAQEAGRLVGLSAHEVSKAFLDNVGRQAQNLGMPELLDFTKLKDASGMSVRQAQFESVDGYTKAAERNKDIYEEEYEAKRQVEEKLRLDMKMHDIYDKATMIVSGIHPGKKAADAESMKQELNADPDFRSLPESDRKWLLNTLNTIIGRRDTAPVESDSGILLNLNKAAAYGELNVQDVLKAYSSQLLSDAHFNSFMSRYKTQEEYKITARRADVRYQHYISDRVESKREKAQREQEARYAKQDAAKWDFPDSKYCKETQESVTKFISWSGSGYRNALRDKADNIQNERLHDFHTQNQRYPSASEYIDYVTKPTLEAFGSSLSDFHAEVKDRDKKRKSGTSKVSVDDIEEEEGFFSKIFNLFKGGG